ncbi:MAG: L,D-transpeptidase family protein, partial [Desulfobacterales bacterium]
MITRRRLLQGIAAASILGFCRPLWATKRRSVFLKPGEKLKPGEYVWEPELSPEGPVTILVSLPEQMAHVYRNGIEIGVTTVSTGRKGHRTPTGVFVILQKDKHHHSSIYHNASMPNTQRLTWGGICLHAGGLPGYPSSHGCVHLPLEFSAKLFDITHLGTAVIVADEASAPADVVHPGIVLSGDADQMIDQKLALERRKKHKTVPPAAGDHPNRVPIASVVVSGADRSSYLLKDGEIVDRKSITLAKPHQPLGT